jgi:hypothetical protein
MAGAVVGALVTQTGSSGDAVAIPNIRTGTTAIADNRRDEERMEYVKTAPRAIERRAATTSPIFPPVDANLHTSVPYIVRN